MRKDARLQTRLIHAGEPKIHGAVTMPVFQSVTYAFEDADAYDAVRYARLNNTPNHDALAEKLASIEGAEAAVVTSSGMAAVTTVLFGLLSSGDHVLVQEGLYGGTWSLITQEFPRFGIEFDFVPGDSPQTWEERRRPNTKMIYLEAISNPLMDVADLRAGVAFATKHGLVSVIDNTFASPVNFQAANFGFDVVLHSATKYLNGHSDVVAGAISGRHAWVSRLLPKLNLYGGTLDPHACFLLQRGLKTLSLRVERQNENALALARALESHDAVRRVRYPGLSSHPHHGRASDLFAGFGGMLAFEVVGDARAVCRALTLGVDAPSLGGIETLVTRPAATSHKAMTQTERDRLGISDQIVRVSVGIEHIDDLVDDFFGALGAAG